MSVLMKASLAARKLFEFVLALSLSVLALSVLVQIVLRQALSYAYLPLDDLVPYAFSVSTFVGAALLFGENGHIAITVFSDLMPEKIRRPVRQFAWAAAAAFLLFLLVYGYGFAENGLHQYSPLLGIRLCYVYAVVPLSALAGLLFMATGGRADDSENDGKDCA